MLTIVFYTSDSQSAKNRSRQLVAVKGDYASMIDAGFWSGERMKCDVVEIMPDVSGWQRKRIMAVFEEEKIKEMYFEDPPAEEQQEQALKISGVDINNITGSTSTEVIEKKAVHRGGGRWFVMAGDQIISGPHEKAEATRLAELKDEAHAA